MARTEINHNKNYRSENQSYNNRGSGRGRGRGANDTGRGGTSRTFTPRNHEYQGGFDSRYRRDRWDLAPYQFSRGGSRGGRGRGRGGTRGGGYF
jgi:hypothetical protein